MVNESLPALTPPTEEEVSKLKQEEIRIIRQQVAHLQMRTIMGVAGKPLSASQQMGAVLHALGSGGQITSDIEPVQ